MEIHDLNFIDRMNRNEHYLFAFTASLFDDDITNGAPTDYLFSRFAARGNLEFGISGFKIYA